MRRRLPLGVAVLCALLPTGSCGTDSPPVELDPVVLAMIDRLHHDGCRRSWVNDEVTSPASFNELVAMGSGALPTILDMAERSGDRELCAALIDVAGRIGDPGACAALLRLVRGGDPTTVHEALEALGRIGSAEAVLPLRELLAVLPVSACERRLEVLEAIHRCGDASVLGDVLAIGLGSKEVEWVEWEAARIASRHPPLRRALGFEGPYEEDCFEFFEESLFLRAADEWYREALLGQPSPWRRSREVEFAEPHRAAKEQAWRFLWDRCRETNDRYSHLRLHPVDPKLDTYDAQRVISVIQGWGHGGGLSVLALVPAADGRVAVHCFRFGHPEEPHDYSDPSALFVSGFGVQGYAAATLDRPTFLALVAGMRTVLEAEVVPWWSGPACGSTFSSADFVVSVGGLGAADAPPVSYCGFPGSDDRERYLRPQAAAHWVSEFLVEKVQFTDTTPSAGARGVFSEVFRTERSLWNQRYGWGLPERMLSMAEDFGDATLCVPLAAFLDLDRSRARSRADPLARAQARIALAEANAARNTCTAALACNALAAITGVELRFDSERGPRPVADVAAEYHALFAPR